MPEAKLKCCDECPGDQTCEHAKWCMCGSAVEGHDIGSGHSPVSMHDYYCHQAEIEQQQVLEDD